jgi:hypothetical protein
MSGSRPYLQADDDQLLADCEVHTYRASGPGGQHRNKVSSAVRVHHGPSGVTAHGNDSRSQHENRRLALKRLRMNIACQVRRKVDLAGPVPAPVAECLHKAKGGPAAGKQRLSVGRKDHRFWTVAAVVLDVLAACEGRVADAAGFLGISTGNLIRLLKTDRHLLTAAQGVRKQFDLKHLT